MINASVENIESLLARWHADVGLTVAEVARFHEALLKHIQTENPIFYIRGKAVQSVRETDVGVRIAESDNAPAWWAWGACKDPDEILFDHVPSNYIDARRAKTDEINRLGFHVAHIVPATLRDSNPGNFSFEDALTLFLRNIHPVNHFYVPIPTWRQVGGDIHVLSHAAKRAQRLYGTIWEEFVSMSGADARNYLGSLPRPGDAETLKLGTKPDVLLDRSRVLSTPTASEMVEYSRARLTFISKHIEPLGWDDRFRVSTQYGTYEFSKREFYDQFPRIVKSYSYLKIGEYHGAKLHLQAQEFRRDDDML